MSKTKHKVEKVETKFISPFGPNIMMGRIPDNIYKKFKNIIDDVIKDKKESHADKLAGRITEEWTIGENYICKTQVEEFLIAIAEQYATKTSERFLHNGGFTTSIDPNMPETEVKASIVGGWVNEMKSGEYNPVHFHPFSNVTSVFFLSSVDSDFLTDMIAPENTIMSGIPVEKGSSGDGYLELIYKSGGYFEQGTFRVEPKDGMFLLFPSSLLHTVYPFVSDKKRISASFNFITESNSGIVNFGER